MSKEIKANQLLIENARIGYPKLFKAVAIQGDASAVPRFGCQLYIPKSDTKTKALLDRVVEALTKEHMKGTRPKTKDLCIKDGDGEDGDDNTRGHWIVSANRSESQGRPQVVNRDRSVIDSSEANIVYAGCYVNAVVSFYVPKNFKTKICGGLEVIQFRKDGEALGGSRVDAASVLDDLSDLDDEEFEA